MFSVLNPSGMLETLPKLLRIPFLFPCIAGIACYFAMYDTLFYLPACIIACSILNFCEM